MNNRSGIEFLTKIYNNLHNEEIVLQTHDFITNKDNFLNTYVDILKQKLNTDVLITNLDKVVFSSNKDYLDKSLSKEFYNFINGNLNVSNFRNLNVVEGLNIDDKALVLPISPNADIVGYIVFMSLTKRYIKKLIRIITKPEMKILPGNIAFFLVLSIFPIITLCGFLASFFSISISSVVNKVF